MRRLALVLIAFAGLSCSGTRASIEIEDAHVSWTNLKVNRHINVDVDLLAHDQLGGNIGQYCLTLNINFQDNVHFCDDDLADGDRRTVRMESVADISDSYGFNVILRHAGLNIGRDLVAPITPKN